MMTGLQKIKSVLDKEKEFVNRLMKIASSIKISHLEDKIKTHFQLELEDGSNSFRMLDLYHIIMI
jgi:hypothetical protein